MRGKEKDPSRPALSWISPAVARPSAASPAAVGLNIITGTALLPCFLRVSVESIDRWVVGERI